MRTIALVPVFNEAPNIINVLTELENLVDEILIVNDGSWDQTEKLIMDWFARGHGGRLLSLNRNRGHSAALLSGYAFIDLRLHAKTLVENDVVVTIDADGQHRPADIPPLLDYLIEHDLDAVRPRRSLAKYTRYKRAGNRFVSRVLSIMAGQRLADAMSGFCVQKAGTVVPVLEYVTGWRYSIPGEIAVILARLGYRSSDEPVVEIPYFRSHTRLRDVAINLALGLAALVRVEFRLRSNRHRSLQAIRHVASERRAA